MRYTIFGRRRCLVLLGTVASLMLPCLLKCQIENPYVDREVVVMFKDNAIQLPFGKSEAVVSEVTSKDAKVKSILLNYHIEAIRKGFPNFDVSDTVKITNEGIRVRSADLSTFFVFRLPQDRSRDSLIAQLKSLQNIFYAAPNSRVLPRAMPNDMYFGLQDNFYNTGQSGGTPGADIKATAAWDITTGSSTVGIAIVDNGCVRWDHEDFIGRVWGDLTNPLDDHATHVAGIAAARGNNWTGVAGVNWNAPINTQKIGDDETVIANAIINAVNSGAFVINDSWGTTSAQLSVMLADLPPIFRTQQKCCIFIKGVSESWKKQRKHVAGLTSSSSWMLYDC